MGWVRFFLGESRSRLYPHMRAKFGRDPTTGSKKVSFKFIIDINYPLKLCQLHLICFKLPFVIYFVPKTSNLKKSKKTMITLFNTPRKWVW